jgi:hypothetical protein
LALARPSECVQRGILGESRAADGEQIIATLARQLSAVSGRGFSRDNLFRMVQLAERFPDREIVGALSRQLGWSHFVLLLPLERVGVASILSIPALTRLPVGHGHAVQ